MTGWRLLLLVSGLKTGDSWYVDGGRWMSDVDGTGRRSRRPPIVAALGELFSDQKQGHEATRAPGIVTRSILTTSNK